MTIKIWLGSLEAYNSGNLLGEWLELPMDEDKLQAAIDKYTDNGQGDYFIADHECDIKGLVGEYSDPIELNTVAETLDSMTDYDTKRVSYLISEGYKVDEALDKYEDVQFYEGMRLKDVAYELVEEGCFGPIPDSIASYIDYDAIARDLGFDGYCETEAGVFRVD
jgi:antirestriction protein